MNRRGALCTLARMNQVADPAYVRSEHIEEWREACKRVMRTYKAWHAADRRDRHALYASFLDALRAEERAAQRVEHDARATVSADSRL